MRTSAPAGPGLVVLGIDPGLRATGWGVLAVGGGGAGSPEREETRVLGYGVVATEKGAPLPERLRCLFAGLREVIGRWQPAEVAVEEAFVAANRRVAITMGEARGVALLAAAEAGLPVFDYSASEVKQAVAGYGRGSKEQVQEMLRLQLGLEAAPQPADAADALATAVCHLARRRTEALVAGAGASSGGRA
jgi:crossover junction endodeoxyribonuclease RuvC